ncbi:MAG: tRNA (adenosine(37)-N6)-dimethylallyltransferase MiaA [Muribaculaceae bacterium]|nr:tRNA (adenosine(37)-N6)-dimethylallyltransferase MiaA [Muribaculaceae bacterium]MBQ7205067.1 tRNA (adenosine(37)-N6)-dimethylallyltransferase MiaA [Muribaculaceae bacterium]
MQKTLIVITGPTGVGKTAAAIRLAQRLRCEIINADSRQIYRGIPICTAAPTPEELALVKHHFVAFKDLEESYSAAQFEADVLQLLPSLWQQGDYAVMCGGSMLYVDAVCRGIDQLPDISPEVRAAVKEKLHLEGLESLVAELEELDPQYAATVDRRNTSRVCHAVEICRQSGVTYTSLRTGRAKQRDFNIVKLALNIDRDALYRRINTRVDRMIEAGLEQEARSVYHLRHLNSLNTVGMKEMFAIFDGTMDRHTAIERMKKNTRVYAKKQLTWYKRDQAITWVSPDDDLMDLLSGFKS